jgi:hypothetical protein
MFGMGVAISLLVMQGCSSGGVSLGGTYDLSDYLFPQKGGTLVYQLFTAQKPKGESSFTEEEYKEDVQYGVVQNGETTTITNKANEKDSKAYSVESNRIAVAEQEEDLSYHFARTVDQVENFVEEAVIKTTREDAGESKITYECNATTHEESMKVEPNPKEYMDILRTECIKKHIITARVGGKNFETIVAKTQENFYAKDEGMIQSTVTECEYTKVDDHQQPDDGCTRKIYKIWAFVAD